ncbi:hypothetical protein LPC08_01605 [Roseomonas sp. OT10]|uniref:hypothetical protein n=1 Tax=Roseomonas cutis TaxID=2897332 RepID=UPI001E50B82D|nr:hypothetical protein [Roseomonas sp. OT10]UFN49369.1 hypothetical protein LPC08_01605 [Roseomonas sp. OT10]
MRKPPLPSPSRRHLPALLLLAALLPGTVLAQDAPSRPQQAPPPGDRPGADRTPAQRAPALLAFEQRLPAELGQMRRVNPPDLPPPTNPNLLTAHYDGPIGGATVQIWSPAPNMEPWEQVEATLRLAMEVDIRTGANSLGPGTWTGQPQRQTVEIDQGPGLACLAVERRQRQQSSFPQQIRLMNRKCYAAIAGHVVGILVSTRFREPVEERMNRAQLDFAAAMAKTIADARTPATPPGPAVPQPRPIAWDRAG